MAGARTVAALGQSAAQALDVELMSPTGAAYTLAQLMELAGLSCAQAVVDAQPDLINTTSSSGGATTNVAVLVGPGNNGGDGLVAARHLAMFGARPFVLAPVISLRNPLYKQLYAQLDAAGVPTYTFPSSSALATSTSGASREESREESRARGVKPISMSDATLQMKNCKLIVDALFGFSFKGPLRSPYTELVESISKMDVPVASVDMPSGWDVERGPPSGQVCLNPQILVSLTAPKLGSRHFTGKHYVGGRFLPQTYAQRYGLDVQVYKGVSQIADVSGMEVVPAEPLGSSL